jgi:hypothetical protein
MPSLAPELGAVRIEPLGADVVAAGPVVLPGQDGAARVIGGDHRKLLGAVRLGHRHAVEIPHDLAGRRNALGVDVVLPGSRIVPGQDGAARRIGNDHRVLLGVGRGGHRGAPLDPRGARRCGAQDGGNGQEGERGKHGYDDGTAPAGHAGTTEAAGRHRDKAGHEATPVAELVDGHADGGNPVIDHSARRLSAFQFIRGFHPISAGPAQGFSSA